MLRSHKYRVWSYAEIPSNAVTVLLAKDLQPREAKEIASSLHQLSRCYTELGQALEGIAYETRVLKGLIGNADAEAKAQDSRLVKAGIALILFPDPTISDLVGISLIAAGMVKNKSRKLAVSDVYKEFRRTVSELNDLTSPLTI